MGYTQLLLTFFYENDAALCVLFKTNNFVCKFFQTYFNYLTQVPKSQKHFYCSTGGAEPSEGGINVQHCCFDSEIKTKLARDVCPWQEYRYLGICISMSNKLIKKNSLILYQFYLVLQFDYFVLILFREIETNLQNFTSFFQANAFAFLCFFMFFTKVCIKKVLCLNV